MQDIDLELYTNVSDMLGYVGFITPEGNFYKVRAHTNDKDVFLTHQTWCEYYLKSLKVSFMVKYFAIPWEYVVKDMQYLLFAEDGNSIFCMDDEKQYYNDLQYQKFNELKELYEQKNTKKR